MKPSISTGMMPPSYGSGYGISQNNFWDQRPVASGKYGIYPEKGEWDYNLEDSDDEDNIDDLDIKISVKTFSSATQIPNDTKTKPDHKSFGNLGSHNLVSHHDKKGNILKEYIREVLKESGISGRAYVKKTLGDPYYKDNNDIGSGINRTSSMPTVRSVQLPDVTSSGTQQQNKLVSQEIDFSNFEDEDLSSFDIWMLFDIDKNNLEKHKISKLDKLY